MWEGQAVPRPVQMLLAICIGLVSLPFAVFGMVGLLATIFRYPRVWDFWLISGIALSCGALGLTLAYRLFWGRGVRRGGGVMSPRGYLFMAGIFLTGAADSSYRWWSRGQLNDIKMVLACLALAILFFVAARHRAAMRSFK